MCTSCNSVSLRNGTCLDQRVIIDNASGFYPPQIQSRNWAQVPPSPSGERCKLPSASGQSPTAKRFEVHFELKSVLLVNSNLYQIFCEKTCQTVVLDGYGHKMPKCALHCPKLKKLGEVKMFGE